MDHIHPVEFVLIAVIIALFALAIHVASLA